MKRNLIGGGLVLLLCGVAVAGLSRYSTRKRQLPEMHGCVACAAFVAQMRAVGRALIPGALNSGYTMDAVTVRSKSGLQKYWLADVASPNQDRNVHIVCDANRPFLLTVTMVDRRFEAHQGGSVNAADAAWAAAHWLNAIPLVPLAPEDAVKFNWRPVHKPSYSAQLWVQTFRDGPRRAMVLINGATGGLHVLRFWNVRDQKAVPDYDAFAQSQASLTRKGRGGYTVVTQ